jgi:type II restriction/modification system DNA methylase subunit YeeA
MSSRHGVGNDPTYNARSVFATFPFPEGLSPNLPPKAYAADPRAVAIAEAARNLNRLRENWLNPSELVERVPEAVAGFPDHLVPINDKAAAELKKRTLTDLYNALPAWLAHAHAQLDEAVASAYGWQADIGEEEVLRMLLEWNIGRAGTDAAGNDEDEVAEEGEED